MRYLTRGTVTVAFIAIAVGSAAESWVDGPLPQACKAEGTPNVGWAVECIRADKLAVKAAPLLEQAGDEMFLGNVEDACRALKLAGRKRQQAVAALAKCLAWQRLPESGLPKVVGDGTELQCRAIHASAEIERAKREEQC